MITYKCIIYIWAIAKGASVVSYTGGDTLWPISWNNAVGWLLCVSPWNGFHHLQMVKAPFKWSTATRAVLCSCHWFICDTRIKWTTRLHIYTGVRFNWEGFDLLVRLNGNSFCSQTFYNKVIATNLCTCPTWNVQNMQWSEMDRIKAKQHSIRLEISLIWIHDPMLNEFHLLLPYLWFIVCYSFIGNIML